MNHYKPPSSTVVVTTKDQKKKQKEEARQITISEDSGLQSIPVTNSGNQYGSTKSRSSTKESASTSAYSTNSISSIEGNSILYQSSDENSDSET